jgi:hypothetical protein
MDRADQVLGDAPIFRIVRRLLLQPGQEGLDFAFDLTDFAGVALFIFAAKVMR